MRSSAYPFKVEIPTPLDQTGMWLWLEHRIYDWVLDDFRRAAVFSFKYAEDAVLFKLTWY